MDDVLIQGQDQQLVGETCQPCFFSLASFPGKGAAEIESRARSNDKTFRAMFLRTTLVYEGKVKKTWHPASVTNKCTMEFNIASGKCALLSEATFSDQLGIPLNGCVGQAHNTQILT